MARTILAPQTITDAGVVPVYTAANVAGHMISPGDILHVKNGSGAPINVTVQTGATLDGKAVADTVVAVAAGAEKLIGDLDPGVYRITSGADTGYVYVDFSAVTTVTCAAFRQ